MNNVDTTPFWDYSDEYGAKKWELLSFEFSEAAKYKYQSPIDINSKNIFTNSNLKELIFNYQKQQFKVEYFTQSIHLVPLDFINELSFGDKIYHLQDIHVHMPSEHTIDGLHKPLEIHFVHRTKNNEVLVLGALFKEGTITKKLPAINWQINSQLEFNPLEFLPKNKSFYTYSGSLTTPPTSGPVTWILLSEMTSIEDSWLSNLKENLGKDNFRPVQPLKDRKIYKK